MEMPKRSKICDIARNMPPLCHKFPDVEFNIRKSHVVRWILKHDEAYEYIWNAIKQSGAIKYDSEKRMWQGVDYKK